MKITITGASGFIGKNLSTYLHKGGHEVVALIRSKEKEKFFEKMGILTNIGDVTEQDSLNRTFIGTDLVIHLAALFNNPEASWEEYRRVNVEGTRNVLTAALKSGVKRVVHCSTVGVATRSGGPPYSEETSYSPPKWDKYEVTKCEGEKLALAFHKEHGLQVVVIRPAQVYGPGDKSKAKFYRMVKKGVIANPGKTKKHLIFIHDLCQAFEMAAVNRKAAGEILIIGGRKAITLREYVSMVADELEVSFPKLILPATPITWLCALTEFISNIIKIKPPLFRRSMDFFTKSVEFDVSKAQNLLGFQSQYEVKNGISITAAWYKKKGLL